MLERHCKIQGIIQFLLNRWVGGGASLYMADPVRFVCGNREISSPGSPSHLRSKALHVATLSLKPSTSDMWIPISSAGDEDLQWWMLGHNVRVGARVIPKELGAYLFMDALNISWALEPLDSLRYLVNSNY